MLTFSNEQLTNALQEVLHQTDWETDPNGRGTFVKCFDAGEDECRMTIGIVEFLAARLGVSEKQIELRFDPYFCKYEAVVHSSEK